MTDHTIYGDTIDEDRPLPIQIVEGGIVTRHIMSGNVIDEDHPLAVIMKSICMSSPPTGCQRITNIYWNPDLGNSGQVVIETED